MRNLFWATWLLLPLAAAAWHYGPGRRQLAQDRSGEQAGHASALATLGRWDLAAAAYGKSAAGLPDDDLDGRRRLALAQAQALIKSGQLVEGEEQLEALLDDLESHPVDSSLVAGVRHELASAGYFAAWMMRLEGA